MATANIERQNKWKEKQKAEGKKPITVMVSSHVKELIDREKKRRGSSIASIIERAVINYVDPVAGDLTSHKGTVTGKPPLQLPH